MTEADSLRDIAFLCEQEGNEDRAENLRKIADSVVYAEKRGFMAGWFSRWRSATPIRDRDPTDGMRKALAAYRTWSKT